MEIDNVFVIKTRQRHISAVKIITSCETFFSKRFSFFKVSLILINSILYKLNYLNFDETNIHYTPAIAKNGVRNIKTCVQLNFWSPPLILCVSCVVNCPISDMDHVENVRNDRLFSCLPQCYLKTDKRFQLLFVEVS